MEQINNDFVKELNKRKELSNVFSFYSASFFAIHDESRQ
jgi:HAE1 family hydrophobic/amphiphilic exporter-1